MYAVVNSLVINLETMNM